MAFGQVRRNFRVDGGPYEGKRHAAIPAEDSEIRLDQTALIFHSTLYLTAVIRRNGFPPLSVTLSSHSGNANVNRRDKDSR